MIWGLALAVLLGCYASFVAYLVVNLTFRERDDLPPLDVSPKRRRTTIAVGDVESTRDAGRKAA